MLYTPDKSHNIAQRIKCVLKKAPAKEAAKQKKFINCERRCKKNEWVIELCNGSSDNEKFR